MTHTQSDSLTEILDAHDYKILQASKKWDGYPVKKARKELKSALQAHIDKLLVEELEKVANYKHGELTTSAWAIHAQAYIADRISKLKDK